MVSHLNIMVDPVKACKGAMYLATPVVVIGTVLSSIGVALGIISLIGTYHGFAIGVLYHLGRTGSLGLFGGSLGATLFFGVLSSISGSIVVSFYKKRHHHNYNPTLPYIVPPSVNPRVESDNDSSPETSDLPPPVQGSGAIAKQVPLNAQQAKKIAQEAFKDTRPYAVLETVIALTKGAKEEEIEAEKEALANRLKTLNFNIRAMEELDGKEVELFGMSCILYWAFNGGLEAEFLKSLIPTSGDSTTFTNDMKKLCDKINHFLTYLDMDIQKEYILKGILYHMAENIYVTEEADIKDENYKKDRAKEILKNDLIDCNYLEFITTENQALIREMIPIVRKLYNALFNDNGTSPVLSELIDFRT